jgi:hypothetical protein
LPPLILLLLLLRHQGTAGEVLDGRRTHSTGIAVDVAGKGTELAVVHLLTLRGLILHILLLRHQGTAGEVLDGRRTHSTGIAVDVASKSAELAALVGLLLVGGVEVGLYAFFRVRMKFPII